MQGINFFVFISAVEVEFSLAKLDLEEQAYLLFEQILIRQMVRYMCIRVTNIRLVPSRWKIAPRAFHPVNFTFLHRDGCNPCFLICQGTIYISFIHDPMN